MKNLWNEHEAALYADDPLALRVYSSHLLGREPDLVLHGGGNTSLKTPRENLFGESEEALYVKGSGWDLAAIEAAGFAPVRLATLLKMAALYKLGDSDMVKAQRAALLDPHAPTPSVEAVLHALIPFKYVDHTHADAVVTLSNSPDGQKRIVDLYGRRVLIVPYVMPGFVLAKKIYELTRDLDWNGLEGMVLLKHGVFTFANDAKTSYDNMIELVSEAEDYLKAQKAFFPGVPLAHAPEDLPLLARIRKSVAEARGSAVLVNWDNTPAALDFANLANAAAIATRGPLTPDHVIRTKPWPLILDKDPEQAVADYMEKYRTYFQRHTDGNLTCLNPAPCWAVWPGFGVLSFGADLKEARIIADIAAHTLPAIRAAEKLGGWEALPERDIFEMEYWELEQAKLRKSGATPPLQGKVALVTGAASGIGKACVDALRAQGAVVAALDLHWPQAEERGGVLALTCDVRRADEVREAVAVTVQHFGGLDILISNAGTFPAGATIEEMPEDLWDASMAVNLTAHQRVLQACAPYLRQGVDPAVVMIASKNVPAPGPGAAAYSVAKAGQTQLARIAALELGKSGVRVNVLHPNAVFDTGIWSEEILQNRARHYGLSVEAYKTNNILRTEVTSQDVAELACALAGPLFRKTTGAQIPIDGGNERVI